MSSEYYCKFCDITCTGKEPYEQHVQSAKHQKKAKLAESLPSSPAIISTPQINTPSPSPITTINASENSSISSPSFSISPGTMRILLEWNHPLNYPPFCEICQLPLHGGNNADEHFKRDNNIHNQKVAVCKQIHEGDAPYSCKVCAETFPTEKTMLDHFDSESHGDMKQQKQNLSKFIEIYKIYNKLKELRREQKGNVQEILSYFRLYYFR